MHEQADGRFYVGVPVHLGLITGDQMIALAALLEELGGDFRITRQQNFVLTNVAAENLEAVEARLAELGLPLDAGALRGDAIACTGEPHCNFSVTETKTRMDGLVRLLEERSGRMPTGCACISTGARTRAPSTGSAISGSRAQPCATRTASAARPTTSTCAALDRPAAIARAVFKRVPSEELDDAVLGLVAGWVSGRAESETFRSFCDRTTDDELGRLAGREPGRAKTRRRRPA